MHRALIVLYIWAFFEKLLVAPYKHSTGAFLLWSLWSTWLTVRSSIVFLCCIGEEKHVHKRSINVDHRLRSEFGVKNWCFPVCYASGQILNISPFDWKMTALKFLFIPCRGLFQDSYVIKLSVTSWNIWNLIMYRPFVKKLFLWNIRLLMLI